MTRQQGRAPEYIGRGHCKAVPAGAPIQSGVFDYTIGSQHHRTDHEGSKGDHH